MGMIFPYFYARYNFIPNLVETVKAHAEHEQDVFTAVAAARSFSKESAERFRHEEEVSQGVNRLLALAESYPQLHSSAQFLNLQRNLTEIESQISASRRAYNAAVTEWNEGIESFPGNIFAALFKFKRADWFEVKANERNVVEVK